jgi:hypothetical protein
MATTFADARWSGQHRASRPLPTGLSGKHANKEIAALQRFFIAVRYCHVSGYHMAVVAGVVFFAVRALLALIPGLTDSRSKKHQEQS